MNQPHLSYLMEKGTTWFNPSYAITQFFKEQQKVAAQLGIDVKDVWRHRNLKRAKEIYTAAIVAKALQQNEGGQWWLTKPKTDPPDVVIGTLIKENSGEWMHVREVEVVENFDGDVAGTIRQKLSTKRYESHTVLACYLSIGGVIDLEKVASDVASVASSLDNIFLVFPGMKAAELPLDKSGEELLLAMYRLSCVQIKPIFSHVTINPVTDTKAFREGKEGAFYIFEKRGKGVARSVTLNPAPSLF